MASAPHLSAALLALTYDLPLEEQKQAYEEYGSVSMPAMLKQPGLEEIRIFDNPLRTTPRVMIQYEFDSPASVMQYLDSEHYRDFMYKIRGFGCRAAR